jgi:hypothetical protein
MQALSMQRRSSWLAPSYQLAICIISLATIIALFVPFSPGMPAGDLDPSWMLGLNQAQSQGLVFGRDIIFTFGPYASIFTHQYHPAIDSLTMSSTLYLALAYWLCFLFLIRGARHTCLVLLFALFAGTVNSRDALLFSAPLMIGLAVNRFLFKMSQEKRSEKRTLAFFTMQFSVLGLLPLVKGSLIILCILISFVSVLALLTYGQKRLAVLALVAPPVSLFIFWSLSGQPPAALPDYGSTIVQIISGYTEAMAREGTTSEIALYAVACLALFAGIVIDKSLPTGSKLLLGILYSIFLFLSMKAGFVRHDEHAIIAGTGIMIAAILLTLDLRNLVVLPIVILAAGAWLHIDRHYTKTSVASFSRQLFSTFTEPLTGMHRRMTIPNWPRLDFEHGLSRLHDQIPLPPLSGSTDIYPFDISYLLASSNHWSPRAVFQSYSAYTPLLAETNRLNLSGITAPNNIFFKLSPIDNKLPALDDGASWPLLLSRYTPVKMAQGYLLLKKRLQPAEPRIGREFPPQHVHFGETVMLPQTTRKLLATIDIHPTRFGKIASIFFKTSQLDISVALQTGPEKKFRLIAAMAKSAFIVSPLVETASDFALLYSQNTLPGEKRVESISITPHESPLNFWENDYVIAFSELDEPHG